VAVAIVARGMRMFHRATSSDGLRLKLAHVAVRVCVALVVDAVFASC
jgi:hypothetical protein